MCATPSYIIVNNEQDNNFSFDLVSESNNKLKNNQQQQNINKSEYLKTNDCTSPIDIHRNIDFLDQNEITENEKPIHFLNLRDEELNEHEKSSYQRDVFKEDAISLSKSATENKDNKQKKFDFIITNTTLDHSDKNFIDKSSVNVKQDIVKENLINNFNATNSSKVYIKENAEILHKSDNHCVIDANIFNNENALNLAKKKPT